MLKWIFATLKCPIPLLFPILFSVDCLASVPDSLGFGSRAIALGGAYTAIADDASAVYYNPAGLTRLKQIEKPDLMGVIFEMGILYSEPDLYIKSHRGDKTPQDIKTTKGLSIGVVLDLERLLNLKSIAFGLGLYVPLGDLFYWRSQPSDMKQFPFYDDYTHGMSILCAFAYRIFRNLSFGAGIRGYIKELYTDTYGKVKIEGEEITIIRGHFNLDRGGLSPILGMWYKPLKDIGLGLTYRHENYIDDFGGNYITDIPFVSEVMEFHHHFAHYYTPNQLGVGISYNLSTKSIISSDITWKDWSEYLDSYHLRPNPEFKDTYLPRVGLSYQISRSMCILSGYYYYKSPAPEQSGETNLIDMDKHVLSLGVDLGIDKMMGSVNTPATLTWHIQVHHLKDRWMEKDDSEESYGSGGYLYNTGFTLLLHF